MSEIRSSGGIRKYPFYPVIFSRTNNGSYLLLLKGKKSISFWTSVTKRKYVFDLWEKIWFLRTQFATFFSLVFSKKRAFYSTG